MKRTVSELLMLLREGGNISIDANEYTVLDIRTLVASISKSQGSLELRNCDKLHTSDLLMLVRYGKNNIKFVL